MAGHKAIAITITVGDEVLGWKIDEAGAEELWPQLTSRQLAERVKELIRDSALRTEIDILIGNPARDAWKEQHLTELD